MFNFDYNLTYMYTVSNNLVPCLKVFVHWHHAQAVRDEELYLEMEYEISFQKLVETE